MLQELHCRAPVCLDITQLRSEPGLAHRFKHVPSTADGLHESWLVLHKFSFLGG